MKQKKGKKIEGTLTEKDIQELDKLLKKYEEYQLVFTFTRVWPFIKIERLYVINV